VDLLRSKVAGQLLIFYSTPKIPFILVDIVKTIKVYTILPYTYVTDLGPSDVAMVKIWNASQHDVYRHKLADLFLF